MTQTNILVVEDEGITARDLQMRLNRLGYGVTGLAHSAEEAIACAAETHPDLVLMDIGLPGKMDGVEAAAMLRSRFGIPVTYLTAHSDEETLERARATSPYGFVLKPFEERELHATIQMAMRRHRVEKDAEEAHRWLAAILSSIEDGVIATHQRGGICFMNPVAEALTGWTQRDALGRGIGEVLCVASDAGGMLPVPAAGDADAHRSWETEIISRDGHRLEVEASVAVVREEDGEAGGLVWAFRDIRRRKRAEASLKRRAEVSAALARVSREVIGSLDSRALLENLCRVTTAVMHCDFSHTWLWNPEERVYEAVAGSGEHGEQWESIQALKIPRALVADLAERLECDGIAEIRSTDPQNLVPAALPLRYGVSVAMYIALRRGGEMIGIQMVGFSGHEQRFSKSQHHIAVGIGQLGSLALEHARLREEVDWTSRLKSDFMATLSHELRQPLNVAMLNTQLLLENGCGALNAQQAASIRSLHERLQRMEELIHETLDLSRLERQRQIPINTSEVRVSDLLALIAADIGDTWSKPAVEVQWRVEDEVPALLTDAVKLKVVIKNLVVNALKYTDSGTVAVTARPCAEGCEFEIRDTGSGIAPEAHAGIFEPFCQYNPDHPSTSEGVGLGLYIVRRMLELLGGSIELQSEVGCGSTFRVRVPRRIPGSRRWSGGFDPVEGCGRPLAPISVAR